MASEIRVDKITSLSGVGTITPSPTGIDIAGITTVATLKATTGIVTTLTATTGIVTTFEATTGNITTLRTPTGISTDFTADKITLPNSTNGSLNIGVSSAFKINHNGTDSFITEVGGGDLYIQGSDIIIRDAGTLDKYIEMTQNGAVDIYHDNSKKFETTSAGVSVTGSATVSGDIKTTAATVNIKSGSSINTNSDTSAHGALHKNTNSGQFAVVSGGTGGNNYLSFFTSASAAPTEKLRITSTGDIKIGDQTTQVGALRYLDVQNSDSSSASSGAIIRLISSNQAQNSTTSVDLAKYRDGAFYINNNETHSGAVTVFQVGGSEIARFTTSGLAIGGTGDANTLEDYEEGTYTPTNHAGTATFTNNTTARYRKIGQMVYVQYDISISSSDGGTNAGMTMPFASSIAYGSGVAGWTTLGRPAFMHISGAYAYFMDNSTSGSSSQHLVFNETNGHRFIGSFWYIHTG